MACNTTGHCARHNPPSQDVSPSAEQTMALKHHQPILSNPAQPHPFRPSPNSSTPKQQNALKAAITRLQAIAFDHTLPGLRQQRQGHLYTSWAVCLAGSADGSLAQRQQLQLLPQGRL